MVTYFRHHTFPPYFPYIQPILSLRLNVLEAKPEIQAQCSVREKQGHDRAAEVGVGGTELRLSLQRMCESRKPKTKKPKNQKFQHPKNPKTQTTKNEKKSSKIVSSSSELIAIRVPHNLIAFASFAVLRGYPFLSAQQIRERVHNIP